MKTTRGRNLRSAPLPYLLLLLTGIALTSLRFFSFSHHRPHTPTSTTWLSHIQSNPYTERLACREYDAGAQSCVFEGLACINTTTLLPFARPKVYILDNDKTDNQQLPSDHWCSLRHQSSDPRYFSSRHWPIKNDTIAPQQSCLDAEYRTLQSLELETKVRWLPNIWLVDLDYAKNDHNNHLLTDIIWILDVVLWERSLHIQKIQHPFFKIFDATKRSIYLPQGRDDFVHQTARDINRLIYSLVLQLDSAKLYPNYTSHQLYDPPPRPNARRARPLLDSYPQLRDSLLFHRDLRLDNATNLVCTSRLTVGAKIGNGAHERVCRHLRQSAYDLFGISRPAMRRLGQIYYPQPPKRIIILQRHIRRSLANLEEIEIALRSAFEKYGVDVEVFDTRPLATAEGHVRLFSRAGVLITPHGSQSMGQIFMPRHSALVEIMPVGYTDYGFNLLAESCKIWYYELQGVLGGGDKDKLLRECGDKVPHMMDPCTERIDEDVWADVPKVVETVGFALERMGYAVGEWLSE